MKPEAAPHEIRKTLKKIPASGMRQLVGLLLFACLLVQENESRRTGAAPLASRRCVRNARQLYSLRTFANGHAFA